MKKKINIGLASLRIYLSFLVVTSHCFFPDTKLRNNYIIKIILNTTNVPTFYIMSFYFCYKLIKLNNIKKIKMRFQRLLIPYFVWPIIIWSFNYLLSFSYINIYRISFKDFVL